MTLRMLDRFGVTSFCAPPTAYRMMVLEDLKQYDLRGLRHCTGAGEPLNPEVMKQWEDGTGLTIYDGYGQTETVLLVGNYRCLPVRPGSMGKPIPGFTIGVVDEEGSEVPVGEEGQIAVKVKPERPLGPVPGILARTMRVWSGRSWATGISPATRRTKTKMATTGLWGRARRRNHIRRIPHRAL